MRMFNRGIENIKFLMEKHDAEWRREQGEDVELPKIEDFRTPVIHKPKAKSKSESSLDENRFLSRKKKSPKVESVQVLPGAEHHSWLYNEVMKAINDAAAKNKNSRIIAIFVPVLQNSKEFEDLPVDEAVTISSEPTPESQESQENLPDNIISGIPDEILPPEVLEIAQKMTEPTHELESGQAPEELPEIESLSQVEEISQDEPELHEPDNLVFEEISAEEPAESVSEPELIAPVEVENLQEIPTELESDSESDSEQAPAEEVIILEEPSQNESESGSESESDELEPIAILDIDKDDSDNLPEIKPLDDLDELEDSITEEPELILPADDVIEIESSPAPSESSETTESESPEIAELQEVELKAPDLEGDEIAILLEPEEDNESGEKIKE